MRVVVKAAVLLLLAGTLMGGIGLPHAFALEPGARIINRASVSFVARGSTHVVEDSDVLVAAADAGNSPPHGVTHDGGAVAENSPGARIGRLGGMDIDSGETFSFATDDPRFLIPLTSSIWRQANRSILNANPRSQSASA